MARYVTAAPFRYIFGFGRLAYAVDVPEGVRCIPIDGEPGSFFVDDISWLDGIARHDATYRGIRATAEQVRAVE